MEGEGHTCFLSRLHLQATCTEGGLTESTSLTLSQDWVTGEHSLPWTYQLPTINALIWASKIHSGTSSFLAMRFGHYAFIYNIPYLWMYQVSFFFLLVLLKYNWHAVVQSLSHGQLSVTPWTAGLQATLFSTISQSLLKLMSIESMMLSNHFILHHPLLLLPSIFPSIRVFSNELALYIRWPSIGASALASVLPRWFRQ